MAYDTKKQGTQKQRNENPYSSLTEGSTPSMGSLPAGSAYSPGAASPLPATPPALQGGNAGPTATGHVNFDQVYQANAGTADREAKKIQAGVDSRGQAARTGMVGAQEKFGGQMRTGSVQGPTVNDWRRAELGDRRNPSTNTGHTNPDIGSMFGQPAETGAPNSINPRASTSDESWISGMRANAGADGYSGPSSLADLEQYQQLMSDVTGVSDEAGALGMGNAGLEGRGLSSTDAALLGASGRPRFAELAEQYGGMRGELDRATAASAEEAKRAKQQTEEAINEYRRLTGAYDSRKASEDDEPAPVDTAIRIGAAPGVGGVPSTVGYAADTHDPSRLLNPDNHGSNAGRSADSGLKYELADALGIEHANGFEGSDAEIDELINALEITDDEWAQLTSMTNEQRVAWVNDRKKKKGIS